MSATAPDLWSLTFGQPWIDPNDLMGALERAVLQPVDYRTTLLIRDSLDALQQHWGKTRLNALLEQSPRGQSLRDLWHQQFEEVGFPTLRGRLMDAISPETVLTYFRDLGVRLRRPAHIVVGGSVALILYGELRRATDDIDVVDELPVEIRNDHQLMNEMAASYGLRLTHFQSHYLPIGWVKRVHSLDVFDRLSVDLVDAYDIFLSKMLSARRKDLDDLRVLAGRLEKSRVEARLRDSCGPLLAEPRYPENAARNWKIVYGEELPT